eukprot:gnl/TRDRNA2_/TRDRNA2_44552_c0_seq2.p1 gnl/TRDRNA2_/TRDRNA2_44552_c0~~gnl/TRDRNA2_/TRDRNA2_44552_c0_seq2.p1  ORF type:complete len:242 (+),score=42.79 gnl/TRDRNA2_/TRDRNA2_44552_c0_seq2:65-790(+)
MAMSYCTPSPLDAARRGCSPFGDSPEATVCQTDPEDAEMTWWRNESRRPCLPRDRMRQDMPLTTSDSRDMAQPNSRERLPEVETPVVHVNKRLVDHGRGAHQVVSPDACSELDGNEETPLPPCITYGRHQATFERRLEYSTKHCSDASPENEKQELDMQYSHHAANIRRPASAITLASLCSTASDDDDDRARLEIEDMLQERRLLLFEKQPDVERSSPAMRRRKLHRVQLGGHPCLAEEHH